MNETVGERTLIDRLRARFDVPPRSLAVFSASWPLARALRRPPDQIAEALTSALVEAFPQTTIMMPTFTNGFSADGICDLDRTPSTTGFISEAFRVRPDVRRTRSAFFSFGVAGPERDDLVGISPREAWGEGSLYHWMHAADTPIVTIGLHPTHCSFSHLIEWLHRDRVTYRFNKTFRGMLRLEGCDLDWVETLFVLRRDPSPVNDFTWLLPHYLEAGMWVETVAGITMSVIGAATKIKVMDKMITKDPFVMIKNRSEILAAIQ